MSSLFELAGKVGARPDDSDETNGARNRARTKRIRRNNICRPALILTNDQRPTTNDHQPSTIMTDQTVLHDFFSDMWGLVLIRGIASLLLGILLITQPLVTISVLVLFMGAYWLIDGIMLVISSIKGRKHTKGWGMGLFFGALGALAGLFVMGAPAIAAVFTATFLVYLLAFAAIISGISNIVSGIRLRKEIDNEWAHVLGGVLWLLLGFALLGQPMLGIVTAVYLIAGISIAGGIVLIYLAWKARAVAIRMADAT